MDKHIIMRITNVMKGRDGQDHTISRDGAIEGSTELYTANFGNT